MHIQNCRSVFVVISVVFGWLVYLLVFLRSFCLNKELTLVKFVKKMMLHYVKLHPTTEQNTPCLQKPKLHPTHLSPFLELPSTISKTFLSMATN